MLRALRRRCAGPMLRILVIGYGRGGADAWSTVASALTLDGRVIFVDDGHRANHELVEGPGP